jgi:hypothetical protein
MDKDFQLQVLTWLTRIDGNLSEHMRRTELLEAEVKPLKKYVYMLMGALTLVTGGGVLVALVKNLRDLLFN